MPWPDPIAPDGLPIGLLGGSFDPPHEGHLHISREALRRFGLARVWWLVSPGNPLKARGPAPLADRIAAARALVAGDPRIAVTGIEARLGTRYTAETLATLIQTHPRARFVWLMGADNLLQFRHWQDWRAIMETVPVGVLARPGSRLQARLSLPAQAYAGARLAEEDSRALGRAAAPAWCYVTVPMSAASSTAIRARTGWGLKGERREGIARGAGAG